MRTLGLRREIEDDDLIAAVMEPRSGHIERLPIGARDALVVEFTGEDLEGLAVLGLLRATGVLCVYGSGFGTNPSDGFFRVVFLAAPSELGTIYDDVATFTRQFLTRGGQ